MSRSDEFLYSGMTSASAEPKITPRSIQREEKEKARIKLKPAADVVLEALSKEREAITDLRSFIIDRKSTEQEVNTELLARKLYLGYINSLEAKIKNIMAVAPKRLPRE